MSNGGSVNAASWYDSQYRDRDWDPAWGDHGTEILAVNMMKSSFYEDARVWGDMVDTPVAALLRALAWIATRSGLGTEYKVNDVIQPDYCGTGRPKTVQWIEELGSIANPEETIGYRLWIVSLDPNLKFRDGFRQLIVQNKLEEEEHNRILLTSRARSGSKRAGDNQEKAFQTAAGVISGGMLAAPERRIMDDVTLANRIFSLYLGHAVTNTGATVDALYSQDVLRAGGVYDPLVVLGESSVFTNRVENVCEEQRDASNYFQDDGTGLGFANLFSKFKGNFPKGVRYTRLLTQYFQPDFLCGTPLPDIARSHLEERYQAFLECNKRLTLAKNLLQTAIDTNNRKARLQAEDSVAIERANVVHQTDEMDDSFVAIRRSAPGYAVRGGSISDSLSSTFIDDVIIKRNDLRKLHVAFTRRTGELKAEFIELGRKRSESASHEQEPVRNAQNRTYSEALQLLRNEMYSQFWRVFRTSPRVTSAIDSSRAWFQKRMHMGRSQWAPHFMCAQNLSPFGNMVVRMTNDFGDTLAVETNFGLMWLSLLTVLTSHQYKFGLRPNIMVTGTHAAGKSYIVEKTKEICFPGAILSLTHMTTHALNGDDDISGVCIVMEEVPLDMIGVDKWGNTVASDPFLKNRLTAGITTTLAQDRSEDVASDRKARMYVSRCMVGHMFLSNDPMPDKGSALLSRFIQHPMRRMQRADTDGQDRTFAHNIGCDDNEYDGVIVSDDEVMESYQLVHFYMFLWESAIEAGAMPDIETETAYITAKWIFDELATTHNVPRPSRRHIDMMMDYCRALTMYYGVQMEFFSEYGYLQRMKLSEHLRHTPEGQAESVPVKEPGPDATREEQKDYIKRLNRAYQDADNIRFEPWMLGGLVKWGVVTQEIVVFVISLMEFLWVPKVRTDIVSTLATLAGVKKNKDTGEWVLADVEKDKNTGERSVDFRQEYEVAAPAVPAAPAAPGKDTADGDEGEGNAHVPAFNSKKLDYRYIEIRCTTLREAAQKLQQLVPNPPSENDIIGTLTAMANDHIESKPKHFVDKSVVGADGNTTTRRVLEDVPDGRSEQIPIVRIEQIPERYATDGNHRRICLAVDVINQKFGPALKESIRVALAHKFQKDATFITAFPCKHVPKVNPNPQEAYPSESAARVGDMMERVHVRNEQMDGANDEALMEANSDESTEETLYNVFDVIEIKRHSTKIQTVTNPYGRTENEIRGRMVRRRQRPTENDLKRFRSQQAPVFEVKNNVDDTAQLKYWQQQGVDISESPIAYAPMGSAFLKNIYTNYHMLFGNIDESTVKEYPKEWIDNIDERRNKVANMSDRPEWGYWEGDPMTGVYDPYNSDVMNMMRFSSSASDANSDSAYSDIRGSEPASRKRPAGCEPCDTMQDMIGDIISGMSDSVEKRRKRARR